MSFVSQLTRLIRRKPKESKGTRPFKTTKYDMWYRFRYYMTVTANFGRLKISVYMLVFEFLTVIAVLAWHLGLAKAVADNFGFNFIAMFELTIIIWVASFSATSIVFLSDIQNRRAVLDWFGFLSDRTRKRTLPTSTKTKMLTITRLFCYLIISMQVVIILWWWSVLPNMPESWHNLEPWKWHPLGLILKQFWIWVLGFLVSLGLERFWFVRRTRVPLGLVFVSTYAFTLFMLWWATNNINVWIDLRGWFGS